MFGKPEAALRPGAVEFAPKDVEHGERRLGAQSERHAYRHQFVGCRLAPGPDRHRGKYCGQTRARRKHPHTALGTAQDILNTVLFQARTQASWISAPILSLEIIEQDKDVAEAYGFDS
jgi:hypothetical protein